MKNKQHEYIGVWGGGGGLQPPPKFGQVRFFWAVREIWAKCVHVVFFFKERYFLF